MAQRRGAVVKTMGEGVMCASARIDDAVETALTLQRDVAGWCAAQGISPALTLKIGVRCGRVIGLTANHRLDYFGRTVNVAARLGAVSRGGDVVLLPEVHAESATQDEVGRHAGVHVETFRAELRGLGGERELVRVTLGATSEHAAHEPAARRSRRARAVVSTPA